ncbi:MAG TPA: hypothetical protein VFO58_20775 [Vicinamibacterales bacterium]|nr:hypothetical protein [Vicinamibacterales bacterium]
MTRLMLLALTTVAAIAAVLALLWVGQRRLMYFPAALFQSRLAHAAYTAAPEPVWPESAAAEAIGDHGR